MGFAPDTTGFVLLLFVGLVIMVESRGVGMSGCALHWDHLDTGNNPKDALTPITFQSRMVTLPCNPLAWPLRVEGLR